MIYDMMALTAVIMLGLLVVAVVIDNQDGQRFAFKLVVNAIMLSLGATVALLFIVASGLVCY
jgi:uncharacterized membrane protein YciS (DUF1049 family)